MSDNIDTNVILTEVRAHRKETGTGMRAINLKLSEHGERLARVETTVGTLTPRVDKAQEKASRAVTNGADIRGQWKALALVLGGLATTGLGILLHSLIGG